MQFDDAARTAPVKVMEPDPAVAVIVPPPHEPTSPFGVATTRPAGKESEKEIPVSVTALFGFVMPNVNDVLASSWIEPGEKLAVIVGGTVTDTAPAGERLDKEADTPAPTPPLAIDADKASINLVARFSRPR